MFYIICVQAGINSFHTNDYKKLVGTFHHTEVDGQVLDPFDRDVFGDDIKKSDCETDGEDSDTNGVEESFDARFHWFDCPSISHIWNQGSCAADWVYNNNLLICYIEFSALSST